ncbi:putative 2-oxoglutarate/Fe(II)-dependent dioxygenase YbiX [Lysobacter niabensis]|uniref:2-oxoglutarate/Fe(II)-dependent dioxygenase YbiX n=1 Tax=Agrilutibacter niabensis TaxID=380628 RepID=A0ABU1VPD8_9GAMM|nr:2OG-Fe(II) oxygenase [Lysobacter niabensis]MDR7099354.1 putative 2-oxoglutarate/Fe(II)-dependent dioxygenase YbiX [Lysobacter niabensis]
MDAKELVHRRKDFFGPRNAATRVDLFEELTDQTAAALRAFFRGMGAPHLFDEVVVPTLHEGASQIVVAVQDRPWPPWGLGARNITAVCQTHEVGDASYAISPVYALDQDLNNIGMLSAVYKEALEQLAVDPRAEVCYLLAEGSVLADQVLSTTGFKRSEDVFVTSDSRYHTYRMPAALLLERLGLDRLATPDLLAHDFSGKDDEGSLLRKLANFHHTIYLGARPEWIHGRDSEIVRLPRGVHAGKPGGVPSGTGRFPVERFDPPYAWISNFLSDGGARKDRVESLVEHVLSHRQEFAPSTVVMRGDNVPKVNEKLRRSLVLNQLGQFESLMAERIKASLPDAIKRMGRSPFKVGRIEMQITANGDGDYFRLHPDTDGSDSREISFVYFFHREPRRFSGGELRIYEVREINGQRVPADHAQTISPRQDTLVFFPSSNDHEVLPVRVPSEDFADSRFTIAGWIHRA